MSWQSDDWTKRLKDGHDLVRRIPKATWETKHGAYHHWHSGNLIVEQPFRPPRASSPHVRQGMGEYGI